MVKLVNRAKMTTATTGTGTITLGAAVSGFQTFTGAGVVDGDVVRYVIEDGDAFEIGTGVFGSAGGTLTRNPSESSAGGGAITLTGNALVFVGAASADVQNDVTVTGGTIDGTVIGGSTPATVSGTTGAFSGNVGIGTSSPDTNLSILGAGATLAGVKTQMTIQGTGSLTADEGAAMTFATGATRFASIKGASASGAQASYMAFFTRPSSANMAEAMRIDSAGRLGIGTSTITEALTVEGNIRSNSSIRASGLVAAGDATAPHFSFSSNTNMGMFRQNVNTLGFSTNGAERLRITGAGTLQSPGGSAFVGTVATGSTLGAIIQRGSNANGAFVRFADGTQICTARVLAVCTANTRVNTTFDWPASFAANPSVSAETDSNLFGPEDTLRVWYCTNKTTTTFRITTFRTNNTDTSGDVIGIGRWF